MCMWLRIGAALMIIGSHHVLSLYLSLEICTLFPAKDAFGVTMATHQHPTGVMYTLRQYVHRYRYSFNQCLLSHCIFRCLSTTRVATCSSSGIVVQCLLRVENRGKGQNTSKSKQDFKKSNRTEPKPKDGKRNEKTVGLNSQTIRYSFVRIRIKHSMTCCCRKLMNNRVVQAATTVIGPLDSSIAGLFCLLCENQKSTITALC